MANGAYIALSAAVAAHKRLDVVANNLANVNTTGFKEQRLQFGHVLAHERATGREAEKGYVATKGSHFNFEQGPITATHNPMDLALHGNGFLVVQGPESEAPMLTRSGALHISSEGELVDSEGRKVLMDGPGEAAIVLSENAAVEINEQGEVFQNKELMGTLRIVQSDTKSLQAMGDGRYASDPRTWTPAGNDVRVLSGHLESSNVNAISNLTQLIEINRGYQSIQRILDRYSKMDRRAIDSMG